MSGRTVLMSMAWMIIGATLCVTALVATGELTLTESGDDSSADGEATEQTAAPAPDAEPANPARVDASSAAPVDETEPAEEADESTRAARPAPEAPPTTSAAVEGFRATFDTPEDFYERFDYGFSGQDPASNRNGDRLVSWTGDHDMSCGAPTTLRTIDIDRDTEDIDGGTIADFDQMFWWCRQHVMTAVSTVGYTIAWFSPKQYFTDISRVCWDLNVTEMSSRKWTQVLFVSEADATANPSDRGSGGYDLGYTNPMFRDQPGAPSAGVLPIAGDLAGMQVQQRGYVGWFEDQDSWTTESSMGSERINGVHDKATRYEHCIEQIAPGTIRFTQQRPPSHGDFQQIDMPGTIPQGAVRVVFQDDNYNGPKGELYKPDVNTWHWDNIVIE